MYYCNTTPGQNKYDYLDLFQLTERKLLSAYATAVDDCSSSKGFSHNAVFVSTSFNSVTNCGITHQVQFEAVNASSGAANDCACFSHVDLFHVISLFKYLLRVN